MCASGHPPVHAAKPSQRGERAMTPAVEFEGVSRHFAAIRAVDDVDLAIGEGSFFHETYGYYAQGVGPETATLPGGWQDRLVRVENANTGGVAGLCLDTHDLAISKYVAGREKDLAFTRQLARHRMTRKRTLEERLQATRLEPARRALVAGRIERDFQQARRR